MKAYKFLTKVSDKGIIQLPHTPNLLDKEVEIIIFPKEKKTKKAKGAGFVKKWAGFLKTDAADQSKYEYLSDKYR